MEWRPPRLLVCLPLVILLSTIKSRRSFILALVHRGSPRKRSVKRLWLYYVVLKQWLNVFGFFVTSAKQELITCFECACASFLLSVRRIAQKLYRGFTKFVEGLALLALWSITFWGSPKLAFCFLFQFFLPWPEPKVWQLPSGIGTFLLWLSSFVGTRNLHCSTNYFRNQRTYKIFKFCQIFGWSVLKWLSILHWFLDWCCVQLRNG